MITIRPVVKKDYYNHRIMNLEYVKAYDGLISILESPKKDFYKNHDLVRFIELNDKPVGYYSLIEFSTTTNEKFNLIRDMYVRQEHSKQGIAKQARQYAIKKDKIHGIVISYGRARKNIDYFIEQGFIDIAAYPNEIKAEDHHLCILSCNTKFTNGIPLNLTNLNMQQKIINKLYHKNMMNN